MVKIRRCDKRCHEAKGSRCRCWCKGYFHGAKSAQQRREMEATPARKVYQLGGELSNTLYVPSEPKQAMLL